MLTNQRTRKTDEPAEQARRLHPVYRGKVQMAPKCPIRGFDDFAIWYTPGVAAPCRDIRRDRERVYELTNRSNSIAVISDAMALDAADALAEYATSSGISETRIVPRMDEWKLYPHVAAAVGMRAQEEGLARIHESREDLRDQATAIISAARRMTEVLMKENLIARPTEDRRKERR